MSNTMAEAFCEEHLMTWTEHGEDFTDWRDGDTFTNLHRMTQAGAVTLFQPMEKNGCFMILTVFRDRSWIIQQETHRRDAAHGRNRRGRTPHPGLHPPDAGGRGGTRVAGIPHVSGRPGKRARRVLNDVAQPETPTRKEPEMSNTMAEALCEEYLITWTEHGEDFTGWRDEDIFTRSHRMSQAGAISLFHQLEDDRLLIVSMFQDQSWIVQHEPTGGVPPLVGTREDEHRILDLVHRTLEPGLERLAKETWMDIVAVLAQAKQMSRMEPQPPESPTHPDAHREPTGSNDDATNSAGKPGPPWR